MNINIANIYRPYSSNNNNTVDASTHLAPETANYENLPNDILNYVRLQQWQTKPACSLPQRLLNSKLRDSPLANVTNDNLEAVHTVEEEVAVKYVCYMVEHGQLPHIQFDKNQEAFVHELRSFTFEERLNPLKVLHIKICNELNRWNKLCHDNPKKINIEIYYVTNQGSVDGAKIHTQLTNSILTSFRNIILYQQTGLNLCYNASVDKLLEAQMTIEQVIKYCENEKNELSGRKIIPPLLTSSKALKFMIDFYVDFLKDRDNKFPLLLTSNSAAMDYEIKTFLPKWKNELDQIRNVLRFNFSVYLSEISKNKKADPSKLSTHKIWLAFVDARNELLTKIEKCEILIQNQTTALDTLIKEFSALKLDPLSFNYKKEIMTIYQKLSSQTFKNDFFKEKEALENIVPSFTKILAIIDEIKENVLISVALGINQAKLELYFDEISSWSTSYKSYIREYATHLTSCRSTYNSLVSHYSEFSMILIKFGAMDKSATKAPQLSLLDHYNHKILSDIHQFYEFFKNHSTLSNYSQSFCVDVYQPFCLVLIGLSQKRDWSKDKSIDSLKQSFDLLIKTVSTFFDTVNESSNDIELKKMKSECLDTLKLMQSVYYFEGHANVIFQHINSIEDTSLSVNIKTSYHNDITNFLTNHCKIIQKQADLLNINYYEEILNDFDLAYKKIEKTIKISNDELNDITSLRNIIYFLLQLMKKFKEKTPELILQMSVKNSKSLMNFIDFTKQFKITHIKIPKITHHLSFDPTDFADYIALKINSEKFLECLEKLASSAEDMVIPLLFITEHLPISIAHVVDYCLQIEKVSATTQKKPQKIQSPTKQAAKTIQTYHIQQPQLNNLSAKDINRIEKLIFQIQYTAIDNDQRSEWIAYQTHCLHYAKSIDLLLLSQLSPDLQRTCLSILISKSTLLVEQSCKFLLALEATKNINNNNNLDDQRLLYTHEISLLWDHLQIHLGDRLPQLNELQADWLKKLNRMITSFSRYPTAEDFHSEWQFKNVIIDFDENPVKTWAETLEIVYAFISLSDDLWILISKHFEIQKKSAVLEQLRALPLSPPNSNLNLSDFLNKTHDLETSLTELESDCLMLDKKNIECIIATRKALEAVSIMSQLLGNIQDLPPIVAAEGCLLQYSVLLEQLSIMNWSGTESGNETLNKTISSYNQIERPWKFSHQVLGFIKDLKVGKKNLIEDSVYDSLLGKLQDFLIVGCHYPIILNFCSENTRQLADVLIQLNTLSVLKKDLESGFLTEEVYQWCKGHLEGSENEWLEQINQCSQNYLFNHIIQPIIDSWSLCERLIRTVKDGN